MITWQIEEMDFIFSIFDSHFAIGAIISAVIAALSIIMEKRRHNRKNLNKTGFMPWNLISVLSTLATVMLIALAIKIG